MAEQGEATTNPTASHSKRVPEDGWNPGKTSLFFLNRVGLQFGKLIDSVFRCSFFIQSWIRTMPSWRKNARSNGKSPITQLWSAIKLICRFCSMNTIRTKLSSTRFRYVLRKALWWFFFHAECGKSINVWSLSVFQDLLKSYGLLRRTRPDGNCFFRGLAFAYFEMLLDDEQELRRFLNVIEECRKMLIEVGFSSFTIEDFHDTVGFIVKFSPFSSNFWSIF